MGNQANEKFQTGNRVEVYLRGEGERKLLGTGPLGRLAEGTNVNINVDLGTNEVHVIGTPEPQDLVDGAHRYSATINLLRLVSREAADLVNAGRVDIDFIDRITGKRVQTIEQCQIANGAITLPANALITRNLTFKGLRVT